MFSFRVLLDLGIILIAAKLLGTIFQKIGLPQVVGMIVAGLLIGPNVLGLVEQSEFLITMAELGVIMILFTAGLETDLKELKSTGIAAIAIAIMGVIVPIIGGYLLYGAYNGSFAGIGTPEFFEAIFIGVILTATSVSVTVEALREMGKLKGKIGTTILSAAIIDDIIGVIILTFIIGLKNPEINSMDVVINIAVFFIFVAVLGYVIYKLFKYLDKNYSHRRRLPIYGFAICLILSYIAEVVFGIADITGAFAAGVIMCNIASSEYIVEKIDVSSYMLFTPIFFVSIGFIEEISNITTSVIIFSIALIIVAILTKIIGCGVAAKMLGFNNIDSARIGVGMMARGEVALIVAQKGLSAGILNPMYFTSVVFLVILSSIATPIVLKVLYKNKRSRKKVVLNKGYYDF
ncbi:MAG: cation:proton antiporter [Cellulosilyticaceae bacterium]